MKRALTSTTRLTRILIACAVLATLPGSLFGSLFGSPVQALDTHTRIVSPLRSWAPDDLARFDPAWVHVKFVEGSDVVLERGRFVDAAGAGLDEVNAALGGEAIAAIRRTFTGDRATLRAWKARGEARSRTTGPDLALWFDVRVEGGRPAVARLVNRLNACAAVEIAHPAAVVEPASIEPLASPGPGAIAAARAVRANRTPDFSPQQGYLYAPPNGLNAPVAWAVAGGLGTGVKFIDVELAWCADHEDFDQNRRVYVGGAPQNPVYQDHGTAVLGEIIGQHNGFGVSGFAPDVRYGMVAVDINEWPTVPHRFQDAIDHLDAGDVWLIELQMFPPGHSATPMEWLQVNYDVIWTSSWSRDIVCIEAGANGSQNLDDAGWGGVFDRNIRDSGAIMVAAGTPYGRVAESFTNWGSRMDAHAWGSGIVTTGTGDLYNGGTPQTCYTGSFNGTSGASPMLAGSALCLQGIAQANQGQRLDPIALRALIHDTGVPHLDPAREIGPRPDLGAAIEQLLGFSGLPDAGSATAESSRLRLSGAPSPFAASVEIRFALPEPVPARVIVYDAAGRRVRTLVDGLAAAGEQRLTWDGRDDAGRDAASGVYWLRLWAGEASATRRIERVW
jgi:serine protease